MPITFAWPAERPYQATIMRIIDGDTIMCHIDMGLRVFLEFKVRLVGIAAAAVGTPSGDGARAFVVDTLPIGAPVVLTTIKDYKYGGEFVARVWLPDGTNVNQLLIDQQWAAPWSGNGAQPAPPWPRTVTP